jgi:hypothetical protein
MPAPVEIAASKMAFADRIDRTKDLQDIKFIQEKFGIGRDEILQKLFSIERETHRRSAIMVWNQLEALIAQIPERQSQHEVLKRERLARQNQGPEQELGHSL